MSENTIADENNNIFIKSRKHIDITGVREVLSFDDNTVVTVTSQGDMTVEGEELKIGVLDTDRGVVSVDGKISAVIYYDTPAKGKKKLFGRSGG